MFNQRFCCLSFLLVFTTAWSDAIDRNLQGIAKLVDLPVSIERRKDCPNGLELLGKDCVATEILKPDFVCPPFTTTLNGNCVSFARALRKCPENFVQSGDACLSSSRIPASSVCDQGEPSGHQCRIETEVPPSCPMGFQRQADHCVRFSAQRKVCPTGYELQDERCVKRFKFSSRPVCPSDYSLTSDGTCTKSIPASPRCDAGFLLVGGECIQAVSRVPSPCPDGFTAVDYHSCQREQRLIPRSVCPSDFTLDSSNRCVQELPTPATCPSGTTRGAAGQCERAVAKQSTCQGSEQLVEGRCRLISYFSSELKCPSGYSLSNHECRKVDTSKPLLRCSLGVLQNGQCVTQSSTPTRLQCPSGFQVDKGFRCVRDVPYDCPKPVVVQSDCGDMVGTRSFGLRRRIPNYKYKAMNLLSYKHLVIPTEAETSKTSECQLPKIPTGQTCTKLEVKAVQYVCPNGSPPEGKTCSMISVQSPQVYCKVGRLDEATGECVSVSIQPTLNFCPRGSPQPDGRCREVNERQPTLICPEESLYVNGRCVVTVPEVHHPNQVIRHQPQAVCDVGVLRGLSCIDVERLARNQVCPSGSEERSDRCVVVSQIVNPQPVVLTQAAEYVCPNGSAPSGKMCFSTEVIPPESVCSDGILENARCVHSAALIYHPRVVTHTAARFTCPSGQQQEDQCSVTSVESATLECPSGFDRYKDGVQECLRSHDRVPVCPVGSQRVEGSCIRKTYVPPRVTEIKVCTKGQPGC